MFSQRLARRVTIRAVTTYLHNPPPVSRLLHSQVFSSKVNSGSKRPKDELTKPSAKPSDEVPSAEKKKTQAELDKELEMKMQGLAGDGGEFGAEFEDGQPVAMKKSVRNNMFRYI